TPDSTGFLCMDSRSSGNLVERRRLRCKAHGLLELLGLTIGQRWLRARPNARTRRLLSLEVAQRGSKAGRKGPRLPRFIFHWAGNPAL
ncbi:MAG TPA: hypothetical protein VM715_20975, partial [Candidatus Acidoferrum sp.]|nr:hypothetical protein [Candidatus Acidoferrum sp.]